MNLVTSIPIFISSVLSRPVTHRLVFVAPFQQPTVNVVFVRVDQRSRLDKLLNDRLDRRLLHILQQA